MVSPIDLLPDNIPGIGFIDDIAYAIVNTLLIIKRENVTARVAGLKVARALGAGEPLPPEISAGGPHIGCLAVTGSIFIALGAGVAGAMGFALGGKHAAWGAIPFCLGLGMLVPSFFRRRADYGARRRGRRGLASRKRITRSLE